MVVYDIGTMSAPNAVQNCAVSQKNGREKERENVSRNVKWKTGEIETIFLISAVAVVSCNCPHFYY